MSTSPCVDKGVVCPVAVVEGLDVVGGGNGDRATHRSRCPRSSNARHRRCDGERIGRWLPSCVGISLGHYDVQRVGVFVGQSVVFGLGHRTPIGRQHQEARVDLECPVGTVTLTGCGGPVVTLTPFGEVVVMVTLMAHVRWGRRRDHRTLSTDAAAAAAFGHLRAGSRSK